MSAAPNAPAPVSAQGAVLFPGNLRANPRLSQWLGFSLDRDATCRAAPMQMTPAEFGKYLRDDIEKWAKVVKLSGAKVQ